MRILLTFALIFYISTANGQRESKIAGVWDVIGFGNEELYIDVSTDSISTSENFKPLIDSFATNIIASMPRSQFIFKEDGRFIQMVGDKEDGRGIYRVDKKAKFIYLEGERNELPIRETFRYEFKGEFLFLTESLDEDDVIYKLKRVE